METAMRWYGNDKRGSKFEFILVLPLSAPLSAFRGKPWDLPFLRGIIHKHHIPEIQHLTIDCSKHSCIKKHLRYYYYKLIYLYLLDFLTSLEGIYYIKGSCSHGCTLPWCPNLIWLNAASGGSGPLRRRFEKRITGQKKKLWSDVESCSSLLRTLDFFTFKVVYNYRFSESSFWNTYVTLLQTLPEVTCHPVEFDEPVFCFSYMLGLIPGPRDKMRLGLILVKRKLDRKFSWLGGGD